MLEYSPRQFLRTLKMEGDFLTLHTSLAPEALKEKLRRWEPWSHRLDFDNGVSTLDCARRTPFTEAPLLKFAHAASAIPFAELAGGRLLDIGCNAGYNSIRAALKYQFSTTGVDTDRRHIEVARSLAAMAGASCDFELAMPKRLPAPGRSMWCFISERCIICPTLCSRFGRPSRISSRAVTSRWRPRSMIIFHAHAEQRPD